MLRCAGQCVGARLAAAIAPGDRRPARPASPWRRKLLSHDWPASARPLLCASQLRRPRAQRSSARSHAATNASGEPAISTAVEVAVMAHDIGDRGRHHGQPAARYSGVLVGADEPGRLVYGERHQGHVPAAQVDRAGRHRACRRDNGMLARRGSSAGSIFTTGPTMTSDHPGARRQPPPAVRGPSARRSRRKSRAWAAQPPCWSSGSARQLRALREMRDIDARGKRMDSSGDPRLAS